MKIKGVLAVSIVIIGIFSLFLDNLVVNLFNSPKENILTKALSIFDPTWIYVVFALILIAVLALKRKDKWILPLSVSLFFSVIISFVIKFAIMRPRPLEFMDYLPFTSIIDYSFPSSHAAFIFAALPLLNQEFKQYRYLWIGLAVIVAFSRIYFNAHYLSDVIFGALIGYSIGYFILKYFNNKDKKKK